MMKSQDWVIFYKFVYIKTDDIWKDIAENVENRFDTLNYKLDRPLLKEKNKKVIGLMKDKLRGEIVIKVVGLKLMVT